MRVGVVAVQGGFAPHLAMLTSLGHEAWPVRTPEELEGAQGIVLPGGESTAQLRLLASAGLVAPLHRVIERGAAVLATCAGLILAAARVVSPEQSSFGWIDVTVARNGWGRQVDSFEATADGSELAMVFIRAPRIVAVGGGVDVLATFGGEPVLVRQDRILAATFHPELSSDSSIHRLAFGIGGTIPIDLVGPLHRARAVGVHPPDVAISAVTR